MSSEIPFIIDTYPTMHLPDAIFSAARSFIAFNLLQAGIFAGRVILVGDEVRSYALTTPEGIDKEIKAQLLTIGYPNGKVQVEDISDEMIKAQQRADMEYLDFALEV